MRYENCRWMSGSMSSLHLPWCQTSNVRIPWAAIIHIVTFGIRFGAAVLGIQFLPIHRLWHIDGLSHWKIQVRWLCIWTVECNLCLISVHCHTALPFSSEMNFILSFCEVLTIFNLVDLGIIIDVGDTFTTAAEKLGRWSNYTSLLPRNSMMKMWWHDATFLCENELNNGIDTCYMPKSQLFSST